MVVDIGENQVSIILKKDLKFKDGADMVSPKRIDITNKCKKGKWVITTEKKEVAGYTCIKATGKYNYNKYTVWFSLDLPKYFGPLMLTSLPGTILKSKNEDTGYSIEASQVIKGGLPIVDPIVAKK